MSFKKTLPRRERERGGEREREREREKERKWVHALLMCNNNVYIVKSAVFKMFIFKIFLQNECLMIKIHFSFKHLVF